MYISFPRPMFGHLISLHIQITATALEVTTLQKSPGRFPQLAHAANRVKKPLHPRFNNQLLQGLSCQRCSHHITFLQLTTHLQQTWLWRSVIFFWRSERKKTRGWNMSGKGHRFSWYSEQNMHKLWAENTWWIVKEWNTWTTLKIHESLDFVGHVNAAFSRIPSVSIILTIIYRSTCVASPTKSSLAVTQKVQCPANM